MKNASIIEIEGVEYEVPTQVSVMYHRMKDCLEFIHKEGHRKREIRKRMFNLMSDLGVIELP